MKIVLRLSLIGLLAFPFVSFSVYANGNGAVSKAKTEDRQVKSYNQSRIAVAIGKFENRGNASDEIIEEIRARIQQCVAGTKFEFVERERIRSAMREQALAVYIVSGKMLSCSVDKHVADIAGVTVTLIKSKIELEVKVVNCETGNIMAMKTVVGHGMDKVMVSGGVKTSAGQGMRDAIDEAGHAVADWLRDVCACPAKVLKVDKAEITIDMNENEVIEGDLFDVIEEGDVIVDPDSGAAIDRDGSCIGRVVITRTGLRTSKAEPVDGCGFPLEKLDIRKRTYKLRRVTKTEILMRKRLEALKP